MIAALLTLLQFAELWSHLLVLIFENRVVMIESARLGNVIAHKYKYKYK